MSTHTFRGARRNAWKVPYVSADDGVNAALLAALPNGARILELGCANGGLGARYKASHPHAHWVGVDLDRHTLAAAARVLDETFALDLDAPGITAAGRGFDVVVLGDVLEHLRAPERLLRELHEVCAPDAVLACCMPNMSHLSVIERIVSGNVMYDEHGLLDRTHLRFFAPRSMYKMLLDCGWLPDAAARYRVTHENASFVQSVVAAATAVGIPEDEARDMLETYQLIVRATPFANPPVSVAGVPDLAIVTAVAHAEQAALDIVRSPAVAELAATVLPLRGATSAAAAFAHARATQPHEWFLVAREDGYFPRGSGWALAAALERIEPAARPRTVVGFSRSVRGQRQRRDAAGAMDSGAVVLHRDLPIALDAGRGWDGWAADLLGRGAGGLAAVFLEAPVYFAREDTNRSSIVAGGSG